MPELPEVEVTRRGLIPLLRRKRITGLWWSGKQLRTRVPINSLKAVLLNNTFVTVERRAKYLLCKLSDGAILVIHLGMTGKMSVVPQQTPKAKHDHIAIQLSDHKELRFHDSRRFGSIAIWPSESAVEKEKTLSENEGIEPFSDDFSAKNLHQLASQRMVNIKSFLMNSKIIAGIGNIYANEILFATGINPLTPARTITQQQWDEIILAARKILHHAIESGGTTISDFLGSSGQPGYFQLQLNVYGKKNDPCPDCQATIIKETFNGRAAYFCPTCQPLGKTKKVSKKRHSN